MDQAAVSAVTASADFSPVVVGIGAIGAAVALGYVALRGVRMLLSAFGR